MCTRAGMRVDGWQCRLNWGRNGKVLERIKCAVSAYAEATKFCEDAPESMGGAGSCSRRAKTGGSCHPGETKRLAERNIQKDQNTVFRIYEVASKACSFVPMHSLSWSVVLLKRLTFAWTSLPTAHHAAGQQPAQMSELTAPKMRADIEWTVKNQGKLVLKDAS